MSRCRTKRPSPLPLTNSARKPGLIGAVNTVRKAGDRLIGHNTDAAGFLRGLTDAGYAIRRG